MTNLNPFPLIDYIAPDYFCDRKQELSRLTESINNQRHTTLISQRKIGKTALLKHLFYLLKEEKSISLHYFDIYATQDLGEFSNLLCNSLAGYFESKPEKFLKRLLELLGRFRPKFSVDELTGKPSVELSLQNETDKSDSLSALFSYLSSLDTRIVIAIDEFQQITNYPEKNVEAMLRSYIQSCPNVSMIYSGSNRHMLSAIFSDYSRPFYQSTGFLFLDKLDGLVYRDFISGHFEKARRSISSTALDLIFEFTLGITWYVQEICNRLYSAGFKRIENKEVKWVIYHILEERAPVYQVYRDLLTSQQFSLLRAMAGIEFTEKPTSSAFINENSLGAASSVTRALEALENKNLVFYEDGKYHLADIFLMRWLQRL